MAIFDPAIFDNVIFDTPVATTTTGGGAGVVIRHEPHRYSYAKYRKYRDLLLAERRAIQRAKELKDRKKREQVLAAIEAAKEAARNLAEDEARAAEQLQELTLAVQSAAEAASVADTIVRSIEVRRLAREVMAQIEDEEISLLLLH